MTSYPTSIDTFSLSRTVSEIFDFKVFKVRPRPLTFESQVRSKIYPPFESSYLTSYPTSIDTFSLSRTVSEIYDFKVFKVLPQSLTFKGHVRSKIFPPFESLYPIFYPTCIDTFSLSRIVSEIFDFKIFRLRPWPLTLKGHVRWNFVLPFESPYITFYLTSIDTFSLSLTVSEIFDFKVFRVRPWPLTFEGRVRSKILSLFESPYMFSYPTSIDPFSLSRTVSEIFDFKVFKVRPWPLTFKGHVSWTIFSDLKVHTRLPIQIPLTLSLYLSLFSSYSTSKVSGHDLWPLWDTVG